MDSSSAEARSTSREPVLASVDIPPRFRNWQLQDYAQAGENARDWMNAKEPWSLYIHGPTGSHKTSLAIALMQRVRVVMRTPVGHFVPGYKAVNTFRNLNNPQTAELLEAWRGTPLLILDDLGKHRNTPNTVEQLLFLLHYRYDWYTPNMRTIVTSQMDLNELGERIDEATARRLDEGMVVELQRPKENSK